jgi:MOB kinase activator 1
MRYEYHWQDSNSSEFRKPTKMSAPDYVDCLMTWTQGILDNEEVFPSKVGKYRRYEEEHS